jgi:hypothetical protein
VTAAGAAAAHQHCSSHRIAVYRYEEIGMSISICQAEPVGPFDRVWANKSDRKPCEVVEFGTG